MKILGLPGVIIETHQWMQDLLSEMRGLQFESVVARYRHWSEGQDLDVNYEAGCQANKSVDCVIAKSLGTYISTVAFDSFNFKPAKAVFIGTPLKRHRPDNFELLLRFARSVPTLFIQQTSDLYGSYQELSEVVQDLKNIMVLEVPGDDHQYADVKSLQKLIVPFLKE